MGGDGFIVFWFISYKGKVGIIEVMEYCVVVVVMVG